MRKLIALVVPLALVAAGCSGGENKVSQAEEKAFREGSKEIPPEAAAAMAKSREEGMRRAQEAMRKSGQ